MIFLDVKRNGNRALWIAVFVLALFATALGNLSAGANTFDSDLRIARWIQQWQGDVLAALEYMGDMLGDTPTAIAVFVGGIAIAALCRTWRITAFLALVGLLRVLGTTLKPIFESPRPMMTEDVRMRISETSEGFGYPSGHSMTAAMIAAVGAVVVWNATPDKRIRGAALTLAVVLMLLVGWSRVWSGAHWPTDVLGGWSYGVALVLSAWGITTLRVGPRSG